jgi:RNA polymerase sigma-70 factor (ECF subfamily)
MNESLQFDQDRQLIAATLAGDRQAFGELVCKYQNRLLHSLFHLTGNELDAQDVAQDAFVLALTRLESFRGQSSFFTWLFRISRNVAITRFRRKKPSVSIDQGADGAPMPLVGRAPAPDERLQRQEDIGHVRLALARLSEEHRAILVLREMDGMDYGEIAEALDLPVGTVRSRLHRARLQLKAELELLTQPVKTD